ncbi:hypothetical protein [Endozoicomonas numazuensis]|uniref:Beta-1,3-glucanase N-terminal domain-containing protein n=1 Tax=Endozoicomonas numazuensis TaxID=1137799 RepID=A0A081NCS4_9GAMM|nr:hypothetical protein [Endozoicomonas numazuensis]KEQ16247.1 hypothetical protein GZ78_23825 [Endozoicomonas numazuensis]
MEVKRRILITIATATLFNGVAQANAPSYRELTIPDGYSVPYFGCEIPFTGNARAIVRTSGEPGQEHILYNVDLGSPGYDCNPITSPEEKNWAGLIMDQNSGRIIAQLQDSGDHRFKTTTIYAADVALNFPVGYAYNENTGSNLYTEGAPIIWQVNSYGNYISSYLPLPKDIDPKYALIPSIVADDGLTVTGTTYQVNYGDEDLLEAGFEHSPEHSYKSRAYNPHRELANRLTHTQKHLGLYLKEKTQDPAKYSEVTWYRSSTDEPFKVAWVTHPTLVEGSAHSIDASANASHILFNGKNSQGSIASFLALFNVTSGNFSSVAKYGKATESLRIDRSGSNIILKTPLKDESYLVESSARNFSSALATRFTNNGLPETRVGENASPYSDFEAFVSYSSYPFDGFMVSPGNSGIRVESTSEIKSAFDYLINYCNVKEMNEWNIDNWHFLYHGIKSNGHHTYYGYYNDSHNHKDLLFTVTVDQSACKAPARSYLNQ